MQGTELLYTPAQAAEMLNLSRSRLYELMATEQIRSVKIGHLRRIARQELVDFIDRLDNPEQ